MQRPDPSEYFEYYGTYIGKVPEGDILEILQSQSDETDKLLRGLPEEAGDKRYAPDKWTIKQVVAHVIDTERVFAFRALAFARKDPTRLPSFEQDAYAEQARVEERSLTDLADEWRSVRRATIHLFRTFDEEVSQRRGVASESTFSVRAVAYIVAGHEIHHRSILVDRYLS